MNVKPVMAFYVIRKIFQYYMKQSSLLLHFTITCSRVSWQNWQHWPETNLVNGAILREENEYDSWRSHFFIIF